jgi:streptogramin lyase
MLRRDFLGLALMAGVTAACRRRPPAGDVGPPSVHTAWVGYAGTDRAPDVEPDGSKAMRADVATRLARIDTRTRAVVTDVALDAADRIGALSFGEGALWATASSGAVLQLDPTSLKIRSRTAIPEVGPIAAGAGAIWVGGQWGIHLSDRSRVVRGEPPADRMVVHRVDPNGTRVATVPLGFVPSFVVTLGGRVWAVSEWGSTEPALVEIDPATNTVAHRIPFDGLTVVTHLTTGDGAVYAASAPGPAGNGPILRVDPVSRHVERISLSGREYRTMRVVAGRGALWVSGDKHDPVLRVDATTGRRTEIRRCPYGTEVPMELAMNADGVWVTSSDRGRVYCVDADSEEVDAEIQLPGPTSIVAA